MKQNNFLSSLTKEELIKLIEAYSKNWLAMDGVWFQSIERKFGMDEAMHHDREAWKSFTITEARRIKQFLGLPEHAGLEGLANYLLKRDVEIITSVQVTNYENGIMTLSDNSTLETMNVFWVAGVRANSIEGLAKEAYGPGNRLLVDLYNCVQGYNNLFAIGDTALMISKEYPKGHPQVVQPAIQQAHNLIQNLDRKERGLEMQPFVYHNKGSMATIGRNHAVVELKNLRFGGFPAWAVWLFIHLMSIVGVKNRLFIFVDWMWSYFTYDPSLRVIIKPLRRDKP